MKYCTNQQVYTYQLSVHSHNNPPAAAAGTHGYAPQAAYCASKGALLPMSKSLALAWAPDHINVNCILPGPANTPFTMRILNTKEKLDYIVDRIPLKRLAEPEDFVGKCGDSVVNCFLMWGGRGYCGGGAATAL